MDGTPQPPQLPVPLASMCRDRWWKTYLHALQIGIRPDSIRRNFHVVARWRPDLAPHTVLFGCPAGVDLVAKDGRRWWTSYSYGPPFPRIRCNRQPTSLMFSFVAQR